MAAAEIKTYKWASVGSGRSAYRGLHEVLSRTAPEADVEALFTALTKIRGAHRVEIRRSTWTINSDWRAVTFRGTDLAQARAAVLFGQAVGAGLVEADRNADHDHAGCIADAARLGVPASYAHTPETYLSM